MATNSPTSGLDELLVGAYIDDLGAVGLVPWSQARSHNLSVAVAKAADEAYKAEGLPRSVDKDVSGEQRAKVWGGELLGDVGQVQGPLEKRARLMAITALSVQVPLSGRILASILGNWSVHMQFRRPSYSCFARVYTHQQSIPLDKPRPLPAAARAELLLAVCLAPAMTYNIRAPIHDSIYSSDASNDAGGGATGKTKTRWHWEPFV